MTADGTAWYWCLFKYGEVWRGEAGHGEARRGWARRGKEGRETALILSWRIFKEAA